MKLNFDFKTKYHMMYPAYFELSVHQKINRRQLGNGLKINGLFHAGITGLGYMSLDRVMETDYFRICPVNNGIYHKYGKSHTMYPRFGQKKMKLLKKMTREYHRKHSTNGGASEFDKSINDISRDIIDTMYEIHQECYLWKINLYNIEHDRICTPYIAQKVCNFEFAIATPCYDKILYSLIKAWNSPTIKTNMHNLIERISNRVYKIGGIFLSWT